MLSRAARPVRMRASTLAEIIDCFSISVVVVDANAKVIFSNVAAHELIRRRPGILVVRGRLRAELPKERQKLEDCISSSGSLRKGTAARRVLAIHRSSSTRPLHLVAVPLIAETGADTTRPRALFLIDPDRIVHLSADLLHTVCGLSPSESRVATVLVSESKTAAAAEELHMSEHTFRSHLKSIFSKTATRRRSDLVRLLSSGLAVIDVKAS